MQKNYRFWLLKIFRSYSRECNKFKILHYFNFLSKAELKMYYCRKMPCGNWEYRKNLTVGLEKSTTKSEIVQLTLTLWHCQSYGY